MNLLCNLTCRGLSGAEHSPKNEDYSNFIGQTHSECYAFISHCLEPFDHANTLTHLPNMSFIQAELSLELCCVLLSVSESSMTNSSEVETLAIQPHKLLILDARSYAAAVANRAKGGGCECPGTRGLSGLPQTTKRARLTRAVHSAPQLASITIVLCA